LLSSLLFVLHPVQTEAVANIVHRSELFATGFYLAGLMLFLKAATERKHRGVFLAGLFIVSLLGMASRENFATFPVMLFLFDLFLISRFDIRETIKKWKLYLPVLISLCYLAFLVLNNTYKSNVDGLSPGIPTANYVLTEFKVQLTYLRLLILPINQNIDYDYPVANTLLSLPVMLSFLGYLALWAISIFFARKKPLLSFSVLWFVVALLPISFLVAAFKLELGDVILEHRLYLPSVGLFVLAAIVIINLYAKRRLIAPIAMSIVLLFGVAAYARNATKVSRESIWKDVIEKSPDKIRGYNNLAAWYNKTGHPEKALDNLHIALKLKPDNVMLHQNLAISYVQLNMPKKALENLQYVVASGRSDAALHSYMGRAYSQLNRYEEALGQFQIALSLDPNAYNQNKLAETYMALGDIDSAIKHFNAALTLDHSQLTPHIYLGLLYQEKGDYEKSIENFKAALKLDPDDSAIHLALAKVYEAAGNIEMAKEQEIKAQELEKGSQNDTEK